MAIAVNRSVARRLSISFACFSLMLIGARLAVADLQADSELPKTPAAMAAIVKHDADLKKAEEAYRQAVVAAKKACIDRLDISLKQATKAGDLEEANRIQAVRQTYQDQIDILMHGGRLRPNAIVVGHRQFEVLRRPVAWGDAQALCQDMGGELASLPDAAARAAMAKALPKDAQVWIGATFDHDRGKWIWSSGDEVDPKLWWKGCPASFGDHAVMDLKGLGDARGDVLQGCKGFICEWDAK